jgi:hypothetical protein
VAPTVSNIARAIMDIIFDLMPMLHATTQASGTFHACRDLKPLPIFRLA